MNRNESAVGQIDSLSRLGEATAQAYGEARYAADMRAGCAASQNTRPEPELESAMKVVEADKAHRSLAADQILMVRTLMPGLSAGLAQLAQGIYRWCEHQGFWPKANQLQTAEGQNLKKAEKIALMHTELSEMLEAVRNGDWANERAECADLAIRLLDYCGAYGINLGDAIECKMYKNYQRPFRHGKAF